MQRISTPHHGFKAIQIGAIAAFAALALATTQANASYRDHDRNGGQDSDRDLTGSWLVTGTPKNCLTGDTFPAATFEALMTFREDGTMVAWLQNQTITQTRSPSHGSWKRVRGAAAHGARTYKARFIHLRYNATTGVFSGRQDADTTLEVSRDGDEFVSTGGRARGFNPDGVLEFEGCSNLVGTRIRVQ